MSSICTLYELGRSLAGLKGKKHYEELNLGPLCKLPLIHRIFKIDSNTKDDDIQQIETVEILKVSHAFMHFIRYSLENKKGNYKNMNIIYMKRFSSCSKSHGWYLNIYHVRLRLLLASALLCFYILHF